MLDIRLLRENPELVKARLATRGGSSAALVDHVLALDRERRLSETRGQELQANRKRMSKEIGAKKGRGEDTTAIEAEVRGFGEQLAELTRTAAAAEEAQRDLLLTLPNLPHEACPSGQSAEHNPVLRTWGEKPALPHPLDHIQLGARRGLFDLEQGARLGGSGFVCYTGIGARLQRALINYCLDLHTAHGYREVSPPFLVRGEMLVGTGQLPKFRDQLYKIEGEDLYLVPTAEVPVTNLLREEIVPGHSLPQSLAAYTPCFRSEAGAAGLGTRGLIRVHQFDKVELVKITTPETSMAELESLTGHAERVLQTLGLHYRVIELCTGDLGFGSTKTYDIEVWAPGQNAYLEVSSCSNFGDFQARRMNLRFKDAEGKNRFCHTLNGSGTAMPRLYVALLETYQQPDGSVRVPAPLQPYVGTDLL